MQRRLFRYMVFYHLVLHVLETSRRGPRRRDNAQTVICVGCLTYEIYAVQA